MTALHISFEPTAPRRASTSTLVTIGLAALLMSGCAMTPKPLDSKAIQQRVRDDAQRMFADQEPIAGPLRFSDVAARAIKYNLDYRLRMMEGVFAQGQLDVSRWDMLPRLLVSTGYTSRGNDQGGRSIGIETGIETLSNSSSVERNRRIAGAEFSWNILDLGVSYYRARALADQTLVAEERKRKVVQNLLQDTRIAYWRALGAQRLVQRVDAVMIKATAALKRARQIEDQGLMPQPQVLAYQRALLDATTLLQNRRQELELARAELTALMNLAPGVQFTLADEPETDLPAVVSNLVALEESALERRPELREEDYRRRITANEARGAIATILPGLSLDIGGQYDSNRLLYNNSWIDTGVRLSANLLRLASIPTMLRNQEAQRAVDDQRRMAQAMAVLTQVRVAALRYALARHELMQSTESAAVDQRLANYAKAASASRVESELELVRTEARALLSDYQRRIAYAGAQAAWGRLYNSIGYDIVGIDAGQNLAAIAARVDASVAEWQEVTFADASKAR